MTSEGDRRLWNETIEAMDRAALEALQWQRLVRQLAYNYRGSPFHRAKFEAVGLRPEDINSLDDFRRIPLTTKDEHRRAQEESLARHGDAFSGLACAPKDSIVRLNATSGTTGTPTLYALTSHDVGVVNEMHARKYWRAGIRPGHVMIQALSLSMFTGGLPLSQGIQHLGAAVVPVGVEGGSRRVLDFIRLTRPDAIIATPSFGQQLIEECPKQTGAEARALGLDWFFAAGEPGGGDPEMRQTLAEGFGARVFDHTGGGHAFHGISCDQPAAEYRGMHFVSEDHCLLEIVERETRTAIEIAEGSEGEMVWTFLDWEGGPLMRYATGDIARLWTEPCPCGMPGRRFEIVGRADDMLIVKGVNVYPQAVQSAILHFRPQVSGAFRIVLGRPGPRVRPPLRIKLEAGAGVDEGALPELEARMRAHFRATLSLSPEFQWLSAGSLERTSHKSALVEIEGEGA